MAKLKFGAWLPSDSWPDVGSERARRLTETMRTCEEYGATPRFQDVTIDPRPAKLPDIWVSGGSRVPDPGEHDVPVIATTVMDRIVKAGNWLSRCSGTQEWVKRDWRQLQAHAQKKGRDPKTLTFDRINARIADLVGAGLEYLVLGPVSDDPAQFDLLAKRVVANFA